MAGVYSRRTSQDAIPCKLFKFILLPALCTAVQNCFWQLALHHGKALRRAGRTLAFLASCVCRALGLLLPATSKLKIGRNLGDGVLGVAAVFQRSTCSQLAADATARNSGNERPRPCAAKVQ